MFRGQHLTLMQTTVAPGTEWQPEQRGVWFIRLSAGTGYLLREKRAEPLEAEDWVLLVPRPDYWLRASQLGALRLECFQVLLDLLTGILGPAEHRHYHDLFARDGWSPLVFRASSPTARQFADLSAAYPQLTPALARCQMLHLATTVLASHAPRRAPAANPELSTKARCELLFQEMTEAELLDCAPSELARRCCCSERHFRRLFRSYFGRPLTPKRTEMRLQKACALLAETQKKIIEIALDSGFQHIGFFNATFKKRFGVTPSEWRQLHRPKGAATRSRR